MENETSKTAETKALNIADVSSSAFKAGYEKRICEQLQRALDGLGQNSSCNNEELDKAAKAWVAKHCY